MIHVPRWSIYLTLFLALLASAYLISGALDYSNSEKEERAKQLRLESIFAQKAIQDSLEAQNKTDLDSCNQIIIKLVKKETTRKQSTVAASLNISKQLHETIKSINAIYDRDLDSSYAKKRQFIDSLFTL